jgi:hypothetical protein
MLAQQPHATQTIGQSTPASQVAAVVVVGEEGFQLGQQAHCRETIARCPACAITINEPAGPR